MKKKIFIVAAVIFSSRSYAQDSTKNLEEVIVTANKFPQKQSETGKVMTVITREQLEKSSGKTIGEILNQQSGITINGSNNNLGTNQTVNIRGASAGNTLILVDGIPVNDPSVITHYFDLNLFVTENIDHIEILKGGQSTLYGSDAVAGVINIITKKADKKPFSLNGGASVGSYNTFKEFINFNSSRHWGNYAVAYTHINSTGFSTAYDSTGSKNFDKDMFDQHALGGNINFRVNKKTSVKVFGSFGFYKTGLDAGAFTDDRDYISKTKNVQSGFGLVTHQKEGSFHFNYLFNYVERFYLNDSAYKSSPYLDYYRGKYIGRTHFAEIYDNWKWSNWQLLLGIDDRFNNTSQYSLFVFPGFPTPPIIMDAKMSQFSTYGSLVYHSVKGFTMEAGSRVNIHSVYGSNATYSINPSYRIKEKVKVFANLYSAFKTPTLYQLYDAMYGNDKLKPETGFIEETGVELLPLNGFTARAVGFYHKTKNKIEFIITDPNTYASQYQNISEQVNYGAELEFAYHRSKLTIAVNYTYTDGKTKSMYDGTGFPMGKDTSYNNLYHIPKNAINEMVGYQFSKAFFTSVNVHQAGKRYEFIYVDQPVILDSYTLVDLYGEYKFGNCKLFASFNNITNKTYFDILGYNSRKFNWTAGLSIHL